MSSEVREFIDEREQRELQFNVELTDVFIKGGAMQVAADKQMTLSEYIQDLMEKDVSETLGYRLVITYDTGFKNEMTDIFTIQDLEESLMPFNLLYETNSQTYSGLIVAYEVWQHDKLLLSTEQLETVATCPFVVPEGLQTKYEISKKTLGEDTDD